MYLKLIREVLDVSGCGGLRHRGRSRTSRSGESVNGCPNRLFMPLASSKSVLLRLMYSQIIVYPDAIVNC